MATFCIPFHPKSNVLKHIATPVLFSSANLLSKFCRCSISILWTPGSPSISSSPYQLCGTFTSTSLTNISPVNCWWALIIFWDMVNSLDTKLAAPCSSVVDWYIPRLVLVARLSQQSWYNVFWMCPGWKSISEEMGTVEKAKVNSETTGSIAASRSVCWCVLTVEMIKQHFPHIFGTKKWAFLERPQAECNTPCWTLSSIISLCLAMTFRSLQNIQLFRSLWPDSISIQLGSAILLLIFPCFSNVWERGYTLFDGIPRRASFVFGHDMQPICNSHILCWLNLPPDSGCDNLRMINSSRESSIGTTQVPGLCWSPSPASGPLPLDKGISFTL